MKFDFISFATKLRLIICVREFLKSLQIKKKWKKTSYIVRKVNKQ